MKEIKGMLALLFVYFTHMTIFGQPPSCEADCTDTTVHLRNGIYYMTKNCQVKASCLDIKSYSSAEELARSCCMSTVSERGEQMVSAGMLNIKSCSNERFRYPLTFRVPVPYDPICGRDENYTAMRLWSINSAGRWGRDRPVKIVSENNREYYEFVVDYSLKLNLDYLMKPYLATYTPRVVKFKVKKGIKIDKLLVTQPFPFSKYEAQINRRRNLAAVTIFYPAQACRREVIVSALGRDTKGNIVALEPVPIHNLNARWHLKNKSDTKTFTKLPRKMYILRQSDFVVKKERKKTLPLMRTGLNRPISAKMIKSLGW